jgi:hypothetical protein
MAYTLQLAEHYQEPSRALGYAHVLDYRDDQLGRQGTHAGAVFVEGDFYCPLIPEGLINATIDFRAGRISEQVWRERLDARRPFALRPKEAPGPNGQRNVCPAEGAAPQAQCDRKPTNKAIAKRHNKTRIPVSAAPVGAVPKVCAQHSVMIPAGAVAKLRQELRYQSPEWRSAYGQLRNTIEGFNGLAKDGAYQALADPSRRRVRGLAAQSIFAAVLIAVANIRKIRTFLEKARADEDLVTRVPRRRRARNGSQRRVNTARLHAVPTGPAP